MPASTPAVFCVERYTLGGFYLARYNDSPVGQFDEQHRLRLRNGDATLVQLGGSRRRAFGHSSAATMDGCLIRDRRCLISRTLALGGDGPADDSMRFIHTYHLCCAETPKRLREGTLPSFFVAS
eukprot:41020-Chlamydomonas_euryale.AAC.1